MPTIRRTLAAFLAESEVQFIMRADHVDEEELLASLTAMAKLLQGRWEAEKQGGTEQMTDSVNYRPGVGIILLNNDNKVFVGHRRDTPNNAWQMPQGGIDGDETPLAAALRELVEEIGTNNVEILAETSGWLTYELPATVVKRDGNKRWMGQRQKWFVMRLLGPDSEINIATEHPEFSKWRWVSHDVLSDLVVPFKRQLYLNLIAELGDVITSPPP
jgi:putative (di)nucleoside polyphosphate hydrolase